MKALALESLRSILYHTPQYKQARPRVGCCIVSENSSIVDLILVFTVDGIVAFYRDERIDRVATSMELKIHSNTVLLP